MMSAIQIYTIEEIHLDPISLFLKDINRAPFTSME